MKKILTIQKINTRSDLDNVTPVHIENYPWGNSYTPAVDIHLAYGPDRYTPRLVDENLFTEVDIETELLETKWTASYTIPFSFIAHFSDKKSFGKGDVIKGNMYKCGDQTKKTHWGCYFNIDLEKADYHRPDFFGEIILG